MMRDKHRYLLVESSAPIREDEASFSRELFKEIIRCIGELSYHKSNPRIMKIIGEKRFIIKSSLEGSSQLVLAFALIKRLEGSDTAFYTLKSSGTIKALQSFEA